MPIGSNYNINFNNVINILSVHRINTKYRAISSTIIYGSGANNELVNELCKNIVRDDLLQLTSIVSHPII